MVAKKHFVNLSNKDKKYLKGLVSKGEGGVLVIRRAHILLKSEKGLIDKDIAEPFDCHEDAVQKTRKRFSVAGLDIALYGNPRSGKPPTITNEQKLKTIAIACTEAPKGHSHWSLQLLAKEVVKKGIPLP